MFKIQRKDYSCSFYETIKLYAIDVNKKDIFGASAIISRHKDLKTGRFRKWEINYGTSGSKTYEEALPYIAVINKAMEILLQLNKKRKS